MTILLISLVWLTALAALVYRLATRPERIPTGWERSPRLLKDNREAFDEAIGAVLASKTAPAEHVRDGAHENLYVRP
jgi:hypothetical protein